MNRILPGLDGLVEGLHPSLLAQLSRGRAALLTNQTGCAVEGTPALPLLQKCGLELTALFSPEHGPQGVLEGDVASGLSPEGLPIHSLYGATRRPTPDMLEGLDWLICDLQDVGARFYTYFATIAYAMEECARAGVRVVVLDRPNPLGGQLIEGPGLEVEHRTFVSYPRVPLVHGLTMGELALTFAAQENLPAPVVVPVLGWVRSAAWPATGLPWRRPSPNLPDFEAAAWYPALCLLEFSDLCVGRGTVAPFRILAAPWLDAPALRSRLLNSRLLRTADSEGLTIEVIEVTPAHATHAGVRCRGLHFEMAAAGTPTQPLALGLTILAELGQVHSDWAATKLDAALPLLGNKTALEMARAGEATALLQLAARDAAEFRSTRRPHLLYPS